MALYYGFYDSYNHDRQYNASDFGRMFDGVITDGVFSTVGEILATIPGEGLNVIVKSGKAWFNRTWTYNDGFVTLAIDLPDVLLPRIDAIVLEINQDTSIRQNTIKVIKGTPATTPAKPILTNGEIIHQYPLAYVTVKANGTSFTAADIDIRVGKTDCPFCTPVQTVDITDLFNNWEDQFENWFNNIKTILEGDVVLNLQNQIDTLNSTMVKQSDKATESEAITGSNNTKWMTPSLVNSVFSSRRASSSEIAAGSNVYKYVSPYYLNTKINSIIPYTIRLHRSQTYTFPSNKVGSLIQATVVGAGGRGGNGSSVSSDSYSAAGGGGGGGGGTVIAVISCTDSSVAVVVGVATDGDGIYSSLTCTNVYLIGYGGKSGTAASYSSGSGGASGSGGSKGTANANGTNVKTYVTYSGGAGGKGGTANRTSSAATAGSASTLADGGRVPSGNGGNGGGGGGSYEQGGDGDYIAGTSIWVSSEDIHSPGIGGGGGGGGAYSSASNNWAYRPGKRGGDGIVILTFSVAVS